MQRLSRFLQGPFPYEGEEDPDLINAVSTSLYLFFVDFDVDVVDVQVKRQ